MTFKLSTILLGLAGAFLLYLAWRWYMMPPRGAAAVIDAPAWRRAGVESQAGRWLVASPMSFGVS